jgi:Tol biopolymer transport system component
MPTTEPAGSGLAVGSLATVIADEPLVHRSAPGTGDDSAILDGALHPGIRLRVVDGPVTASGYEWWRIAVGELEGWAAAASREGEPWLAPVRSGRIAFVAMSDEPGTLHPEMWSMEPDGTDRQRLTDFRTAPTGVRAGESEIIPVLSCGPVMGQPVWSPDGSRIAFDQGEGPCAIGIDIMNADGSDRSPFALGETPRWSLDGRLIAFGTPIPWLPCAGPQCGPAGPWELMVASVADGSARPVSDIGAAGWHAATPSWSPSGAELLMAYESGLDGEQLDGLERETIYRVAVDGSRLQPLLDGALPRFAPDGLRFVFERRVGDLDPFAAPWEFKEIVLADIDGANARVIAAGTQPAWSPDGSQIAFWSGAGSRAHLWVASADGSDGTIVAEVEPAGEERIVAVAADWSPDGRWLAYAAQSTGPTASIHTVMADGSGDTLLGDGHLPSWQPVIP